ncbi:MAG: hypothetical protein M3R43_02960 [Acidobacteriota bacterium]|nr:hypothetical protein [Acidobacteriota bacterium]
MMRLLRNYIFWSYERGSIQYDVMVTAIILFVLVGPHFIDFKAKPTKTVPLRSSEVLVKSSSSSDTGVVSLMYEIRADDLEGAATEEQRKAALLRVIAPISGDVTLESYRPVVDGKGKVVAYDATVRR